VVFTTHFHPGSSPSLLGHRIWPCPFNKKV